MQESAGRPPKGAAMRFPFRISRRDGVEYPLARQRRSQNEANLSTEQHQAQAHARLPGADENPRRARDYQREAAPRQSQADSLSGLKNARAEGLGKQHRLDKPSQYKAVFSNATRAHAGVFFIRSCDNRCGVPRLGLAFSVRAAGKAVARNRLKRLVRESFRRHKNNLPGRDYVVGCKSDKHGKHNKNGKSGARRANGAARADSAQARAAMNRFWEKESAPEKPA